MNIAPSGALREYHTQILVTFLVGEKDAFEIARGLPGEFSRVVNAAGHSAVPRMPKSGIIGIRSEASKWDAPFCDHVSSIESKTGGFSPIFSERRHFFEDCIATVVVDHVVRFPVVSLPVALVSFLDKVGARLEFDVLDDTKLDP